MFPHGERAVRLLTKASRSSITGEVPTAYGSSLESLLLESIDEALTDLLGTRAREAVYDYVERNCLLSRNDIPRRLDVLLDVLKDNFGRGARTISRVIAKKLYAKLDWNFEDLPNFEVTDYVAHIRRRLAKELAESVRVGSVRPRVDGN